MPSTASGRVVICQNPTAGARSGADRVAELTALLEQAGLRVEPLRAPQDWLEHARRLQERGELHAVVAAGGDGTVGRVLNETSVDYPIGVLPLGTENLLAKYLKMPTKPRQVAAAIAARETVHLDAGVANGRCFLLMAGCGFDAEVVRRLHRIRRGHIHHLSYAKPILDSIRSYQYPEVRVYCQRESETLPATSVDWTAEAECIRARWAFVVNLPRYAGGLRIAPQALGDDGLLDVCTFRSGSLWKGLWYLGGIVTGLHRSWSDVVTRAATRIRIESDEPVPYQLDGDPGGELPLEIEVLKHRVTLIRPVSRLGKVRAAESMARGNAQ